MSFKTARKAAGWFDDFFDLAINLRIYHLK